MITNVVCVVYLILIIYAGVKVPPHYGKAEARRKQDKLASEDAIDRFAKAACKHPGAVPVLPVHALDDDKPLAWLCPECSKQLPADFTPPPPPRVMGPVTPTSAGGSLVIRGVSSGGAGGSGVIAVRHNPPERAVAARRLAELRSDRLAVWQEMTRLVDQARRERRQLSYDEQAQWELLARTLAGFDQVMLGVIQRVQDLDSL